MLDQTLRTTVKNLDFLVRGSCSQTGTIWMESNARNHACVIQELVDLLCRVQVPKSHCTIISTWGDHAGIERKLGRSNPILMSSQRLFELHLVWVPHLDLFVVGGRHQQRAILVEFNAFHWCRVTFEGRALCTCVIVPNFDRGIARDGSNKGSLWVDCNITDRSRMSNEFVGSCVGSKAPSKDKAVIRTGDDLFQRWMEDCIGNLFFVALENLQDWGVLIWVDNLVLLLKRIHSFFLLLRTFCCTFVLVTFAWECGRSFLLLANLYESTIFVCESSSLSNLTLYLAGRW